MVGTEWDAPVGRNDPHAGRDLRVLSWGAVFGPVLFTLAWLVLGAVSPGYTMWDIEVASYSPVSQPISGLGLGATAPYMNTVFVVLGVLLITGAAGIVSAVPGLGRRARWTCAVLLALPGVGAIMDGLFDLESMLLHTIGFGLVLTTVVGFPVVGRLVRRAPGWRAWGRRLVFAGPLTLALAVLYFATFDPAAAGENVGGAGLTERILVTEVLIWYMASSGSSQGSSSGPPSCERCHRFASRL